MCTPENFRFRLDNAQPFFKAAVAVDETEGEAAAGVAVADPAADPAAAAAAVPRVLGFVVGTLSASSTLHHESMAAHSPSGRFLCVHSVVVDGGLRRRGLAGAMLRQFVAAVAAEQSGAVDQMALICKAHLIKFYESCGFALVGPSAVVHGKDQWFECRLRLDGQPLEGQGQGQVQAEAEAPQV